MCQQICSASFWNSFFGFMPPTPLSNNFNWSPGASLSTCTTAHPTLRVYFLCTKYERQFHTSLLLLCWEPILLCPPLAPTSKKRRNPWIKLKRTSSHPVNALHHCPPNHRGCSETEFWVLCWHTFWLWSVNKERNFETPSLYISFPSRVANKKHWRSLWAASMCRGTSCIITFQTGCVLDKLDH